MDIHNLRLNLKKNNTSTSGNGYKTLGLATMCIILAICILTVLFSPISEIKCSSILQHRNMRNMISTAALTLDSKDFQDSTTTTIEELPSLDVYGSPMIYTQHSIVHHDGKVSTCCMLTSAGEDKTMGTSDDVEVSVILKRKQCIVDNED